MKKLLELNKILKMVEIMYNNKELFLSDEYIYNYKDIVKKGEMKC